MKNVENQSNIYKQDQHKKYGKNSHLFKLHIHIYREKKDEYQNQDRLYNVEHLKDL